MGLDHEMVNGRIQVWLSGVSFGWAGATAGCTGLDWEVTAVAVEHEDLHNETAMRVQLKLKGAG